MYVYMSYVEDRLAEFSTNVHIYRLKPTNLSIKPKSSPSEHGRLKMD